ncbi:hypothetical protein BB560_007113 [Smittium megazygosporum]|uniref:Uncharacterized protein n=1 Tax=Smittium megazygosporum TaxID=133381 RepID=A0A2T9XYT4_9FUNG|nr:hypothetical protein BB560_007113 [Smittium megazygosporum]
MNSQKTLPHVQAVINTTYKTVEKLRKDGTLRMPRSLSLVPFFDSFNVQKLIRLFSVDEKHLINVEEAPASAPIIVTNIDLAKNQLGISLARIGNHLEEVVDSITDKLRKYQVSISID